MIADECFLCMELDRLSNEAEADLVSTIVSTHAGKLAGNLVAIEPGRIRVRPLSPQARKRGGGHCDGENGHPETARQHDRCTAGRAGRIHMEPPVLACRHS